MAIEFNCPQCGAAIRVPDAAAGARGSCPTCHTKLLVPQVAAPPTQVEAEEPIVQQPAPPPVAPPQAVVENPLPFSPAPPTTLPGQFAESAPTDAPNGLPAEQPMIPQFETPAAPVQFPGPPTPTPGQPIVPASSSVAARVRRRSKGKKSGLWFPILCGVALVGGIAWMYLQQMPSLNGDRVAAFIKNEALKPRTVEKAMIDVPDDIRSRVLEHFTENRERVKSDVLETQFSANDAGLEVQILTGSQTRFVRFPIDDDLRKWYDENYDLLESLRVKVLKKSLVAFVNDWDVAIRNQQGVEDILLYRDSVGLAASVDALGFNVSAKVDQLLYPCVYEDDGFLYFALPTSTKKFKIVGTHTNGRKSKFPGEYNVTVKAARK
ncbi:MAG: hypothetical protein ACKVHE_34115 [Planctomycetales bacterium]